MKNLKSLLMLIAITWSAIVSAQAIDDPLNNAYVWNKLKTNPSNDKLWTSYFGKDLFSLTAEEGANYQQWKSQLQLQKAEEEAEQEFILNHMRLGKVNNDPDYIRLLDNVEKNFSPIESYFATAFQRMGRNYTMYSQAHPSGVYSKDLWIIEQENKLVELRKKNQIAATKS